ncbi:GNAT family N-acetyltransferase [Streptomyces olivaceoviridis]|uniref:GNAT family N-acetyltransferase n=1 Tax=Streptomyces olivaceoviridis TaxID=1921 RepID=UPI0016781A57|nr:GNAT family N-acetyltransferase [Streptomyces olivaceoviridis]
MSERTVAGWRQADDAEEDEAERARITVAPGARGTGLGRVLVQGLLARALRAGFTDVHPRARPGDDRALGCDPVAGFRPVAPGLAESWTTAQPVGHVWLRHDSGAPRR